MAGKIFVTGDCHSDFRKFNMENFPEQVALDKEDYVIIYGKHENFANRRCCGGVNI